MEPLVHNPVREFFVPELDGSGTFSPEMAEEAWQGCRKGVEQEHNAEASRRRVYRLRFRHDSEEHEVTVGKRSFYDHDLVVAIVELPGVYKVCHVRRGLLGTGDTPMVGSHAVLEIEDFDPTSY